MEFEKKNGRRLNCLIDQLDGSEGVKRHSLVVVVVVVLAARFRRRQVAATRHPRVGGFGTPKRSGRRRQVFLVGGRI